MGVAEIEAKVREAQARRDRPIEAVRPTEPLVQLVIRVPDALRQQVHRAAAASGRASTQAWVHDVLASAVDDALDPQRRIVATLRAAVLASLAEEVDSGRYEAVVAEIGRDDPDLA